jgi:uncharacterized protein (DUF1501 family)
MNSKSSRRKFLKLVGAGTCGTIAHRVLTPYNGLVAYAQSFPPAGTKLPVVIVINMAGGCSYNIAPIYNGAYRDKNKTISFGEEAPVATNNNSMGSNILTAGVQGLHPAFKDVIKIANKGELALINSVGYPNPNTSHSDSTDIWFRGTRNGGGGNGAYGGVAGWGARLTSQLGNTYAGFSLGGQNLLINGGTNPPRSVSLDTIVNTAENNLPYYSADRAWFNMTRKKISETLGADYPDPANNRNYINNAKINAENALKDIKGRYQTYADTVKKNLTFDTGVAFTNSGFGNECRQAADLVSLNSLGVQFIYMERGGFDTHNNERQALTNNLIDMNQNLFALYSHLSHPSIDRWNDTTIFTMSEFCRTFENGNGGTDHGHAAPMIVMGGKVNGGIKNPPPSADEITKANGYFHQYQVDFREPFYAAVKKMGLDADAVFPESFNTKNLDLFKA